MASIADIVSSIEYMGVRGITGEIVDYDWNRENVSDTGVSVTIWLKRELPEEETKAGLLLSGLSTKEKLALFNKLREEGYDA